LDNAAHYPDPNGRIAEPSPIPAARMVAGLYDFGDDGRTFIVSSELPGRRGKLTYTSKDVAIAKVLTILNEYSGPHDRRRRPI
jgi:hypothetical protein